MVDDTFCVCVCLCVSPSHMHMRTCLRKEMKPAVLTARVSPCKTSAIYLRYNIPKWLSLLLFLPGAVSPHIVSVWAGRRWLGRCLTRTACEMHTIPQSHSAFGNEMSGSVSSQPWYGDVIIAAVLPSRKLLRSYLDRCGACMTGMSRLMNLDEEELQEKGCACIWFIGKVWHFGR